MKVFFYGLFMDEDVLAKKGIAWSEAGLAFLDGYALRIGERATLMRHAGSRAYGVVMEIASSELANLYAEESVADYVPEPVHVELTDGSKLEASCYNLPRDKVSGTNRTYARALLELATRLGFPESYLDEIRRAREP